VLAAMRAAGVCTPLDRAAVRGWLSWCARPMPDWVSELLAQTAVEAAEQQARAEADAVGAEHRRLLVEERVRNKLLAGGHRFRGEALDVVEQWALYASKELLYGGGDVDELDAAALKAVGVHPKDHTTWLLHHGGCDGLGTTGGCDGRLAELAAERFVAQESARHERRERARRDAELITSGALVGGRPVLAYSDSRAAVVVKLNKVTVQVGHIGWTFSGYRCVEGNCSPAYRHNLSARLVEKAGTMAVGQRIEFTGWGGRHRVGEILQTEGPLLQVGYRLASGQTRTAGIDVLRRDPAGGR
jgi:hypothetical protein